MSSAADQSSLFEPLSVTKFDHTDAIRIDGRDDLFTLRSFLGGDADDEASLLDSFNAEESFFDLPEDVIADLETIPEIDESPTMSPAPMSNLTHSVQRLNISHDSSTTFETALDAFSDSTSTFVATSRTFSDSSSSSSSSSSSQEGFHISEAFAECMRKSSESRQQLNLWQEQVRGNGGSLSVSTNDNATTTSTERKRSRSTIEESATTMSTATSTISTSTPSTIPPSSTATTTDVPSLEAATPPFPKRQARPETVMCTAQFLCGSRPTLTAALEQSRQALKEYMMRARCA